MVEARLEQTTYLAGGDLTAADIIMLFPLTTMRRFRKRDISGYPSLGSLQRIGDRPAFQRAMARCEPGLAPLLS